MSDSAPSSPTIGYLGPTGTFAEQALYSEPDLASVGHRRYSSIVEVLRATETGEDLGEVEAIGVPDRPLGDQRLGDRQGVGVAAVLVKPGGQHPAGTLAEQPASVRAEEHGGATGLETEAVTQELGRPEVL